MKCDIDTHSTHTQTGFDVKKTVRLSSKANKDHLYASNESKPEKYSVLVSELKRLLCANIFFVDSRIFFKKARVVIRKSRA